MATLKEVLSSVSSLANSKNRYVIERASHNLETRAVALDSKETIFIPNKPDSVNPTRHEIFLEVGSDFIKYEGQSREQLIAAIKAITVQKQQQANLEVDEKAAESSAIRDLAFFEERLTQADCHFSAEALSSVFSLKAAENPEPPYHWKQLRRDIDCSSVRVVPKKVITTLHLGENRVTNIEDGYFVGYRVRFFEAPIFEIDGRCTTTYSVNQSSQNLVLTDMTVEADSDAHTKELERLINSKSVSQFSHGEGSFIRSRGYAEVFNQSKEAKVAQKRNYVLGLAALSGICGLVLSLIPVVGQAMLFIPLGVFIASLAYSFYLDAQKTNMHYAAADNVHWSHFTPVSGPLTTPLVQGNRPSVMLDKTPNSPMQPTYQQLMKQGAPLAPASRPVEQRAASENSVTEGNDSVLPTPIAKDDGCIPDAKNDSAELDRSDPPPHPVKNNFSL